MPRLRRRWLASAALLPLLLLTCGPSASGAGVFPPPWPGLPTLPIPDGWSRQYTTGSQGNGLSEVTRARQWIRIPAQAVAAEVMSSAITPYPVNDPEERLQSATQAVKIFLSSPAGATHGYGVGLPTTVRTVAFGAVPIQAGLQLEQLRDADDLPVPLQLSIGSILYRQAQPVRPGVSSEQWLGTEISGQVRVRLTSLAVDGVDVGLGDCISPPLDLDLQGVPYWQGDPLGDVLTQGFPPGSTQATDWMAARGIGSVNGGAANGEVDIPAFSHCLTQAGEDLSPLLTASISGPGNPVTVGWAAVAPGPGVPLDVLCTTPVRGTNVRTARGPFLGDPSDCDPDYGPPTLDYPARQH